MWNYWRRAALLRFTSPQVFWIHLNWQTRRVIAFGSAAFCLSSCLSVNTNHFISCSSSSAPTLITFIRLIPPRLSASAFFSGDAFPAAVVVYILRASVSSMQPSFHSLPPTCVWTSCLLIFFQANPPLTMCSHHAMWVQPEKNKRMSPGGMTHYNLTAYLVHGHQLCQCPFKLMRCNFFLIYP